MLLEWRAYATTKHQLFLGISAFSACLWGMMYVVLNAYTAAITITLTALRTLCAIYFTKPQHQHTLSALFIALFTYMTFLSWQGPISLLPAFAVINTTVALFYLKDQQTRMLLIISSLAWLANDIYWQAWPAFIAEFVSLIININTILKLKNHNP